jgi:hypothetical protein
MLSGRPHEAKTEKTYLLKPHVFCVPYFLEWLVTHPTMAAPT